MRVRAFANPRTGRVSLVVTERSEHDDLDITNARSLADELVEAAASLEHAAEHEGPQTCACGDMGVHI